LAAPTAIGSGDIGKDLLDVLAATPPRSFGARRADGGCTHTPQGIITTSRSTVGVNEIQ